MRATVLLFFFLAPAAATAGVFTEHPGGLGLRPGSVETTLMLSSSVGERYSGHAGGMLEVSFSPVDTLAVGLLVGFLHGELSPIVTDDAGVLGNAMQKCLFEPAQCADINPRVPGAMRQITGVVDAVVTWAPIRLDAPRVLTVLEPYLSVGAGANGTRKVTAAANPSPTWFGDYRLSGDGFGEGGFLTSARFNVLAGGGLRLVVVERVVVRLELRSLFYAGKFDEDGDGTPESRTYAVHLAQLGAGVIW